VLRGVVGDVGDVADPERWRPWRSYALMHLWNTLMPDTTASPTPPISEEN
jgi:AraC family transcriptional regulator of adaptative response / DNA-3-methyladenine glycosylase II